MANDQIKRRIAALSPGAKVRVKLDDGSEVAGTYEGLDTKGVRIDSGHVAVDRVKNVLMDVSSSGPE